MKASIHKKNAVVLVHEKKPVLRHLRLVHHKHTGNVLQTRHTSFLALFAMLVFVGFFLVVSQNLAKAGNVSVGLIVTGAAPAIGATITAPIDNTTYTNITTVDVSGTCAPSTFVTISNDGTLAGSTICTLAGIFQVTVQMHQGSNVLTALNYDNLNQPGPITPTVTVMFMPPNPVVEVVEPVLPNSPLVIPGVTTDVTTPSGAAVSECDQYNQTNTLPTGGEPRVVVVCVPRTVEANEENKIGILVWGGTPPYALNFNWGGDATTLVSMDAPGYKTVKLKYASSGIYNINVQLTDKSAKQAVGESAIEVVGKQTPVQALTQTIDELFATSWFETPVPLYLTALGVTLGFWAGDIFNRRFGADKPKARQVKHSV
jgi:hypothetical protein